MEGGIPGAVEGDTVVAGEGAVSDGYIADGFDRRADQAVVIGMRIENGHIPAAEDEQTGIVDEAW